MGATFRITLLLALTSFASAPLYPQSTSASLSGTVMDSSGAAVGQAKVVATNTATGVTTATNTNETGAYIFPSLQPGRYSVSAELQGFRKAVTENIDLAVSARIKIDLKLELGTISESIQVEASAAAIDTVGASVGNVVANQKVQDLPLQARDAGALIALQAGVVGDNFNGLRGMSQNVSFEGVNIQETRYNGGYDGNNLTITNSVDRVSEFRVITSPADAEFGRGSAQVQLIGRSGTNELHGSAFEFNRVTALSANDFFNNQLGRNPDGSEVVPRDFLIRNQFGARAGGPIQKNKTFFFFLYEGQRQKTKNQVIDTVYTQSARNGLVRYYPGVRNGNASASTPTVDFSGNPLKPAAATGDLQTVSVFGLDPNRMTLDPSGNVAKWFKSYPLPNTFLRGDGLNTAGFIWQRPQTNDNDQLTLRLDHSLTDNHRLSFTWQRETTEALNGFQGQVFPESVPDYFHGNVEFFASSLTSTIRPNLLNEFRAGVIRPRFGYDSVFFPGKTDPLPNLGGSQPFFFSLAGGITNQYTANWAPQGRMSPIYQYADNITWLKGSHAFKGGAEVRFASSNGFNSFYVLPQATIGAGSAPLANVSTTTLPGIGSNLSVAQNLLLNLSGSLSGFRQAFNSPGGSNPVFLPGEYNQRTWRQREYAFFFKDDWKVNRKLTLNLGVRYELYAVPFEAHGKSAIPVGGSAGTFGISGTSFADLNKPGNLTGSLTRLQLVGPNSPNSSQNLYAGDHNNWAPAIGVSYAIANKTVFRAGYGIGYDRNQLRNVDVTAGDAPGLNLNRTFTSSNYLSVANFTPQGAGVAPLTPPTFNAPTSTLRVFDNNLRTPYFQNWNASIQHEVGRGSVVTLRYVGTKGSKLFRTTNLNDVNIFESGILDAFNITRAGGNAPLFDTIFAPVLRTGQTGSDYVRSNATLQPYLADGQVGSLANYINTVSYNGGQGGLIRAAGLPANLIVPNPQFISAYYTGNFANSNYHALQAEYEKRYSAGWTLQANYTWSKAIGEDEGDGQYYQSTYRTSRNRSFDRRLLNFNRTHVFKANGVYELPFGRGRHWGQNVNRAIDAVAGGWKVSGILTVTTGQPFDVGANISTYNYVNGANTPDVVGNLDKGTGSLSFDGNGPLYFAGWKQITDPRGNLTSSAAINAQTSLLAITDASGKIVLQNPLPGTLGTLGSRFFTSPGRFNIDAAVGKTFRITERFNVELRADFINATNTPNFTDPTNIVTDINNTDFGRINATTNNPRVIVLGARFNF